MGNQTPTELSRSLVKHVRKRPAGLNLPIQSHILFHSLVIQLLMNGLLASPYLLFPRKDAQKHAASNTDVDIQVEHSSLVDTDSSLLP